MSVIETKAQFLERRESRAVVAELVPPINSTDDLIRAANAAGSNWFSPGAMRWFSSRIAQGVYGGRYFISSERNVYGDNVRRYTVREFSFVGYVREDGRRLVECKISTVGELMEYDTLSAAKSAARALIVGA